MKNYADELLYEELSSAQKGIVGATTRFEWTNRFWESFVMPAIRGVSQPQEESQDAPPPTDLREV